MKRLKRKWPLRSSTGPSSRRSSLRGPTGSCGCSSTWSMKMWAVLLLPFGLHLLADFILSHCHSPFQTGDRTARRVHLCDSSRRNAGLVSNQSLSQFTGTHSSRHDAMSLTLRTKCQICQITLLTLPHQVKKTTWCDWCFSSSWRNSSFKCSSFYVKLITSLTSAY